jgi:hypothetical protein
MKTKDGIFLSIGTIALIATVGFGGYSIVGRQAEEVPSVTAAKSVDSAPSVPVVGTPSVPIENPTSIQAEMPSYLYKDGIYAAVANYYVPRGSNGISVNLTILNDIVTSVSADHTYNDRESGMYVDSFDSYISSKVVGKSIASLKLSRIGGASLTTVGFNNALSTIIKNAAI